MSRVSPTLLTDLPQAIADAIATLLPELEVCEPRNGRFNLEVLKKIGTRAPAVYVSFLRARPGQTFDGPAHSARLDMAAYVVTKQTLGGLSPEDAAGNICLALLSDIPERRWGLAEVGPAENVGAQTLADVKLQGHGVSLWAVTWEQPVMLTGWDDALPLPIALYAAGSSLGQDPVRVGAEEAP